MQKKTTRPGHIYTVLLVFSLFFIGFLLAFDCFGIKHKTTFIMQPPADSVSNKLQLLVDSVYEEIDSYNELQFRKDSLDRQQKENLAWHKRLNDSLHKLEEFNLGNICSLAKGSEKKIKQELKTHYSLLFDLEADIKKNADENDKIQHETKELNRSIAGKEKEYKQGCQLLNNEVMHLEGAGVIKVKKKSYRFFIARKNIHQVSLHNNTKKNGQSINDIITLLKKDHRSPLMITNGGMYTPSYSAQGLLVENFNRITPLDTAKPDNKQGLNFYLLPNGVFAIDSSGAFIVMQTEEYKKFLSRAKAIKYATQSGPMLVTNGSINPNFRSGSYNTNIRSGVGLMSADRIVFIISDSMVNFFDFAVLFKDVFKCSNALYLDGAISRMYFHDKANEKTQEAGSGLFGPVISITGIKK
jgi:uncharacterized protein YigE (DUF2233 family)